MAVREKKRDVIIDELVTKLYSIIRSMKDGDQATVGGLVSKYLAGRGYEYRWLDGKHDKGWTKDDRKTFYITLDDLSMAVNISSYYLSRIFKENTGENFIDYLTRLRIERAKELLSTTQYSMKEIGIMSGYSDPNYFSKKKKKNVGVTPTEYREGK